MKVHLVYSMFDTKAFWGSRFMHKGEVIFKAYQKQRDYTGNAADSYAQALCTFLVHAQLQGKAEVFYKLLEKAEKEDKLISFIEPDSEILYDDYPVENLILVERKV